MKHHFHYTYIEVFGVLLEQLSSVLFIGNQFFSLTNNDLKPINDMKNKKNSRKA